MAVTDSKQQLKDLLIELFQLDNSDLDFGIYRILNLKAEEVKDFINYHIDAQLEAVKSKILERKSGDLKEELELAKKTLSTNFQVDFEIEGDLVAKTNQYGQLPLFQEPLKKFNIAKEKLESLRVSEDTEKSIYNELYRFFDRYYEGGDFISKPRAGKNNYLIPYEGEEVKLYWANHDQYYIKTGDNFKNYIFNNQSTDPKTFTQVEFKLLDAEIPLNNNKEEKGRFFVPLSDPVEWVADERKLLIKFYYKVPSTEEKKQWGEKQSIKAENKGINQKLIAYLNEQIKLIADPELLILHSKIKNNSKGVAIPLFTYHLERYTNVNKFDYFIHKNLKGFLRKELDFFLKNEIMSIQFLSAEWSEKEVHEAIKNNVLKATVIRDIAISIIEFMGELEDFQKRLFEKKKFVVQSEYCMTLDLIPSEIYEEIIENILTDSFRKQIDEWIQLGFILGDELNADTKRGKKAKSKSPTFINAKKFLKEHDKLVLDTKNLSEKLKWKLLCSFDRIDELTNGLLINSENWQALNLLQSKYKGKVKATYIDPPYNTGGNDFSYKDSYRHSSWLSMMSDRFLIAKPLMTYNGVLFVSNDDNENIRLKALLELIFGEENFIENMIWRKKSGGGQQDDYTVREHEYITFFSKNKSKFEIIQRAIQKNQNGYTYFDNEKNRYYKIIKLAKWGSGAHKEDRPTMYDYPELINPDGDQAFPEAPDGRPGRWRVGKSTVHDYLEAKKIHWEKVKDEWIPYEKEYQPTEDEIKEIKERSILYDIVENTGGTNELKDLWGYKDSFPNPKPSDLLFYLNLMSLGEQEIGLDYFGGSGTNTHAIIRLNRYDGRNRKYISIEMGKYFDSNTLPRIKKVAFSNKWKDGTPLVDESTDSQFFQYLKLEQYEDSLNNIEFKSNTPELNLLDKIRYKLTYAVKVSDSLLNMEKFTMPFNYSMKIVQQNEPKADTQIDLITTFNFLLGIELIRFKMEEYNNIEYRIVFGSKGLQEYIIVWRNYNEANIDLKLEKDWIQKQDWYNTNTFIYCNGDNAFNAHPIEPEFIRLMTEPVAL